jgi:hypothetical protein
LGVSNLLGIRPLLISLVLSSTVVKHNNLVVVSRLSDLSDLCNPFGTSNFRRRGNCLSGWTQPDLYRYLIQI